MTGLHPSWLKLIGERKASFALASHGQKFLYQFLFKKGEHLFVIGDTGSGKTQKGYWLADWIRYTNKETVIWLDAGKNQEIVPLLKLGTPVRIICPNGTGVEFQEYDELLKKWGELQNPPEIVLVGSAGSAWWAVKKKCINIFCFRNAFNDNKARGIWMNELFDTLATWTRAGIFPKIYPFALFGDEAHWFNAGMRISGDKTRRRLSEAVTERALEIRGSGGRLVFFAQNYKNITPASRENLNCTLLCRNARVTASENPSLSRFNHFTPTYQPKHGMFVFSDGSCYPNTGPWTFTFYPMPKIRMRYVGEFDKPTAAAVKEQEIEQEMIVDYGKYAGVLQDLEGYEVPNIVSRWEMPDTAQSK